MGFRRGGAGKRRDKIEPAVIKALRAVGCEVWQINGRALPDLLCKRRGVFYALGVKSGEKARLTPSEREKQPSWPLVTTPEQALQAIGAVR